MTPFGSTTPAGEGWAAPRRRRPRPGSCGSSGGVSAAPTPAPRFALSHHLRHAARIPRPALGLCPRRHRPSPHLLAAQRLCKDSSQNLWPSLSFGVVLVPPTHFPSLLGGSGWHDAWVARCPGGTMPRLPSSQAERPPGRC